MQTIISRLHHTLRSSRWKKWLIVAANTFILLVGQGVASLLGKFYYDQGGKSLWMATLVQSAAFPILYIPLLLFRTGLEPSQPTSSASASPLTSQLPFRTSLFLLYVSLGLLMAADNMMFSIGLWHLPASTYYLLGATQLGFNAVFSFFINSQKITALILNSVVLLTFSASLLAACADSSKPSGVTKVKYALGFLCTLGASAGYSLILSLTELGFEKLLRKETFNVVLDMQIYTSLFSTFACIVGLFASGEWSDLKGEMENFESGRVSYVMTLVWTAIAWQISSVGVVGLIFTVSALFSNVISTLSLPLVPVAALVLYHDKMDGVKVISMLLAIWGFASYIYQQYLDEAMSQERRSNSILDAPDENTGDVSMGATTNL